jgi:peptide/nickel transport system substrate-binding protein
LQQRIGKRDLILYAFMATILISIWLAMIQIDRQWQFIALTQEKLEDQTRDITDLRRALQRGISVKSEGSITGEREGLPETWRGFDRAVAATEMPDYARGDWLVYSFPSQVPSLTPFLSGDVYATTIQQWIVDGLVTRDPATLEWLPHVAESWEISDDGLTISFVVREGVVFSDGEPLTVEDVAFSWRFVMDEKIAAPRARAYYSRIKDVTTNDRTVTFHFEEPYFGSFALAGNMGILPKHFYSKYLESVEAAEEFNTSTGLLLGSGPYRLPSPTAWKPGDLIELVRNERYWGWVSAPFERRIWKTINSDAAQLTEFKNGGIDVYGARPLEYRDLSQDEDILRRTQPYEYYSPRGGYVYIAWNNVREGKPTPFADRRVREAMTYLTDRQRIIDEILLGYAQPANGPFNPLGKQADPELPLRSFDLAKAKALLAEAGFKDRDDDGVLESEDGDPLSFKLTYPAGSDNFKRIMLLLKDLYVRAGVLMEPDPVDWPVLINTLNTKSFDAVSLGWTANFEIDIYQMLHSSQTEPGGDNFISYRDPELDELIESGRREMNEDDRMAIWHQVHRRIWEEQPYTYLFRSKTLIFADRRIRNVQVVRAGLNEGGLWSMPMEWYVPADEQKYSN